MHSTDLWGLFRGVGLLGLPLLVFMGTGCGKAPASPTSIELPDSLLSVYKTRIYPYMAGARAARDSITSYRWEIAQRRGDMIYFGISRPARSLYKGRREGMVGRFIPADTGFAYYEELFWTYRFPADSVGIIMKTVLEMYQKGSWDTIALLECCVSFPDKQTYYDTRQRRWVLKRPL